MKALPPGRRLFISAETHTRPETFLLPTSYLFLPSPGTTFDMVTYTPLNADRIKLKPHIYEKHVLPAFLENQHDLMRFPFFFQSY
jgi:hypothetical protein